MKRRASLVLRRQSRGTCRQWAIYEKLLAGDDSMLLDDLLSTGNQLKAARALAGMSQSELASRAGVNSNTISAMERKGAQMLTSGLDIVTRVAKALEGVGVEFLNHGEPGVKLRKVQPAAVKTAVKRSRLVKRKDKVKR
jgi:transcriptional regulator with XRE-family HTH domain